MGGKLIKKAVGGKKVSHHGILSEEAVGGGGMTKPVGGNSKKYFQSEFLHAQ